VIPPEEGRLTRGNNGDRRQLTAPSNPSSVTQRVGCQFWPGDGEEARCRWVSLWGGRVSIEDDGRSVESAEAEARHNKLPEERLNLATLNGGEGDGDGRNGRPRKRKSETESGDVLSESPASSLGARREGVNS
jgi:hypothetical protein